MGVFYIGGRGERDDVFRRLCVGIKFGWDFIGSKLGDGAICFSKEGKFGSGDLWGVLMYEFVMVAL